jgi:hypothetical protein
MVPISFRWFVDLQNQAERNRTHSEISQIVDFNTNTIFGLVHNTSIDSVFQLLYPAFPQQRGAWVVGQPFDPVKLE